MDLTQVIIAQKSSQNQFRFDLEAYEKAALQRERFRSAARSAWQHSRAAIINIGETALDILKLAKQHAAS